ncbi:MAG: peptidylprolyl isomerase [Rickettsia endosymbiont of Ixodes persulcatus]|nr:peptidylprolyl isomerase [Rickettsia endosymbiont of Ixodes persulcatus]
MELFHILIKHSEARTPDPSLTKQMALDTCKALHDDISSNLSEEIFMDKARKYSRCSSSKRGGYLGVVVGNDMVKEFEEKAFKLEKGEMVGPVESACGFHIIYRR